jgi:hypothetical protein
MVPDFARIEQTLRYTEDTIRQMIDDKRMINRHEHLNPEHPLFMARHKT